MLNAAETLPTYLSLQQTERGASLGISPTDYRNLAATALSITHPFADALMGIYQPESGTAALDIWIQDLCLTLFVASDHRQLRLFFAHLDSPSAPVLLFAGGTSQADWQELKNCALALSQSQ
jgi:hypothetical protein